ncbi:nitrous oxide reductase family maturation protein NosD [Paenibacillus sp. R14(2021)]|uniref:right-handed parallel beta-helix repeat-containing protein n=1 Tax=Paenibacillus sp. R14(2021) TaxID=2859228 RepID=UPI001C615FE2|nr:glycosyl hydrolase family 28-related protein [Paenibacillus sp. R14(2021)]
MSTVSWVNVKDYGAVGDGVTDDIKAIQKAIDNGTNAVVYMPAGTYAITDSIRINNPLTLMGDGKIATVISMKAQAKDGIKITNAANVTVTSLQVRDIVNPGDAESHAIILSNATNATIEHCRFQNSDDTSIRVGYNDKGVSTSCRVLFNDIENTTGGSGIEIIKADDTIIMGNRVNNSFQHGIRLDGALRATAIGNILSNNGFSDISLQSFSDGKGNVTKLTEDCVVQGNQCAGGGQANGITVFNSVRDCLVNGNLIQNNIRGIYVYDPDDNGNSDTQFTDNRIINCETGVDIRGRNSNLVFRGNVLSNMVTDTIASPTSYGFFVDAKNKKIADIVMENNVVTGTLADGSKNQAAARFKNLTDDSSIYFKYNSIGIGTPPKDGPIIIDDHNGVVFTKLGTLETNTIMKP